MRVHGIFLGERFCGFLDLRLIGLVGFAMLGGCRRAQAPIPYISGYSVRSVNATGGGVYRFSLPDRFVIDKSSIPDDFLFKDKNDAKDSIRVATGYHLEKRQSLDDSLSDYKPSERNFLKDGSRFALQYQVNHDHQEFTQKGRAILLWQNGQNGLGIVYLGNLTESEALKLLKTVAGTIRVNP